MYLGFYIAFNTEQVISEQVVERAEETSTYSSLGFCTLNIYQLSHLRPCRESNPGLRGGRRECYHSASMAPKQTLKIARLKLGVERIFSEQNIINWISRKRLIYDKAAVIHRLLLLKLL